MRRGVDHMGVGVGAVIVAADGRLLLSRRGPQPPGRGPALTRISRQDLAHYRARLQEARR